VLSIDSNPSLKPNPQTNDALNERTFGGASIQILLLGTTAHKKLHHGAQQKSEGDKSADQTDLGLNLDPTRCLCVLHKDVA
jgi:hypothetical protein